jgi:hypothetical protein
MCLVTWVQVQYIHRRTLQKHEFMGRVGECTFIVERRYKDWSTW